MSNAQWTVLFVAGLIALIYIGSQGGTVNFATRAKAVIQAMFSAPAGSNS